MASASTGKRQIVTNGIANGVGFAVAVVVAFYMSPILVHGLGDSRYGIWSLVESILAYLALADFGIGAAVLRFVAKYEGLQDSKSVNRVFSTSLAMFAAAGLLVLLATIGLAFFWGHPLGVSDDLVVDTRWLLVLLGVNLAAGLPLGIYGTVLSGLGRYPAINAIRVSWLLIRSVMFVIAIRIGGGVPAIALIITACSLAEHACTAVAAHRYLPGLRFSVRFIDRETFKSIRGFSMYVFLALISGRISYQTDAIVIGVFLAPQNITFFVIASRLIRYAHEGIRSLIEVLTPAISQWEAMNDYASIGRALITGTRYVLYMIIPVQMGLLVFGYPFLAIWMGPRYADLSYTSLAILAVPLPLVLVQCVAARVLYGMGKAKAFSALAATNAGVNLLLSVALVGPLGIEGVALGTSIPQTIYCLAVFVIVCRAARVPVQTCLRQSFMKPLVGAAVLAVVWSIVPRWISPTSWHALIIVIAAGVAFHGAVVVLFEPRLQQTLSRIWALRRTWARTRSPHDEAIATLSDE